MDALHAELTRITTTVRGTVGICAHHIETQHRIAYNADTRFPMASVFKLPVAVYLLTLADRGLLQLDQIIDVQPSDISPGSGLIQSLLFHPGLQLSLANLLELTLVISDNTASDVLLRVVGGPQAVTQFLHERDLPAIRVDRFTKHLVADKYGLGEFAPPGDWSLERYRLRFQQLTATELSAAAAAFSDDERDSMTPAAMTDLLVKIATPGLLSARLRSLLLEIMQRCQTGVGAIKGMLPPETPVAHKTGTLAEVVANDVGIVTLPDDVGQLAIAVCVSSPEAQSDAASACQRVIAHCARAVYDYYRFRSNATHP
jgi:beta-lactamase class A